MIRLFEEGWPCKLSLEHFRRRKVLWNHASSANRGSFTANAQTSVAGVQARSLESRLGREDTYEDDEEAGVDISAAPAPE